MSTKNALYFSKIVEAQKYILNNLHSEYILYINITKISNVSYRC